MPREEHRSPAPVARILPDGTHGPHWRALLEARWQKQLQEVTQLSLAYHGAASDGRGDAAGQPETQRLLRRTVTARRKLADLEEALGRLAAGNFGCCEQCGAAIPAGLLAVIPETRYCPDCAAAAQPDAVTERSTV